MRLDFVRMEVRHNVKGGGGFYAAVESGRLHIKEIEISLRLAWRLADSPRIVRRGSQNTHSRVTGWAITLSDSAEG
jgi:hypothetical protein